MTDKINQAIKVIEKMVESQRQQANDAAQKRNFIAAAQSTSYADGLEQALAVITAFAMKESKELRPGEVYAEDVDSTMLDEEDKKRVWWRGVCEDIDGNMLDEAGCRVGGEDE